MPVLSADCALCALTIINRGYKWAYMLSDWESSKRIIKTGGGVEGPPNTEFAIFMSLRFVAANT